MIIMKFGGSSLAGTDKIRNVYSIVSSRLTENPIVVLSAMKGVTDSLLLMGTSAEKGDESYLSLFQALKTLQYETIETLFTGTDVDRVKEQIDILLGELESVITGVALIQECSPQSYDLIASFGERLCCTVFSNYLQSQGHAAWLLDTREAIITNEKFGSASVQFEKTYKNIKAKLNTTPGIPVATGFIARSERGVTTTLGRNGSDYTASLFGAAVNAGKVEIWTDVDGVLTANPKIVPNAFVVPELNVQEAMELSYFGAEVIHPATMIPAIEKNVPIFIKNTLNVGAPGTKIAKDVCPGAYPIRGIASISDSALINIEGGGMIGVPGIASRVFQALAREEINIIMISQASSEHSICIVIRETDAEKAIMTLRTGLETELESKIIQDFELIRELEIIAIIGENMRGRPGISGKLFSALGNEKINVLAIAQGSSERNVSFVVHKSDTEKTLRVLHNTFLEGFYSTAGSTVTASFRDAVFTGLAPDGGLYLPIETKNLHSQIQDFSPSTHFTELSSAVTAALFPDEIPEKDARKICEQAFPFSPKITQIDEYLSILELYHGPSCAFKDFGASFLATVMEFFLKRQKRKAIILTATSGDTGSAVAKAFHKKENINVVILYPSGRVSPLQEKQLTTVGDNVTALEVNGSFDDCQRMVKEAFVDPQLCSLLPLTSANSINLGRLIPQSFYYLYAYAQNQNSAETVFTVPSGNFGNLTAGVLAWTWGMDIKRFIAATNINDVVPEYLRTGNFSPRPSMRTYSNAMDVGNPSNFDRLKTIFNNDNHAMGTMIHEEVVTDEETAETIKSFYSRHGSFIDPHTAVGYLASRRYLDTDHHRDSRIITLSTAHPGKFIEIVEEATGKKPNLPKQLEEAMKLQKKSIPIGNSLQELSTFLLDTYG